MSKLPLYVFLSLILAFGLTACTDRTYEETVQNFYTAIGSGQINSAMWMLYPGIGDIQKQIDLNNRNRMLLTEIQKEITRNLGLVAIEVISAQAGKTPEELLITCILKFNNATQRRERIRLIRHNGVWKVAVR